MSQWYYQLSGNVMGPISLEELQQKVDDGEITEDTPTRDGPDASWRPASQVGGLSIEPVVATGTIQTLDDEGGSPSDAEAVDDQEHLVRRSPLTLRPCADCGTMVSRHARECPECGRPFRESSFQVPYGGEQPVPVWVFFSVLAVAFVLLSPLVVHRVVLAVASTAYEDVLASSLALVAAGCYLVSMLGCAALGSAVASPRMGYFTGLLMGLFFGPLGVFAASAIDKRPRCPNCFARLNGIARECPSCHFGLTWVLSRRWY
jgi:hypothetical protein